MPSRSVLGIVDMLTRRLSRDSWSTLALCSARYADGLDPRPCHVYVSQVLLLALVATLVGFVPREIFDAASTCSEPSAHHPRAAAEPDLPSWYRDCASARS